MWVSGCVHACGWVGAFHACGWVEGAGEMEEEQNLYYCQVKLTSYLAANMFMRITFPENFYFK